MNRVLTAWLSFVLSILVPCTAFASDAVYVIYKVTYDAGSLGFKPGATLKLHMDGNQIVLLDDHRSEVLKIPASSVTEISYGQDVHRRIGAAIAPAVFSLGGKQFAVASFSASFAAPPGIASIAPFLAEHVGALMGFTKPKKHYVGLVWANGNTKDRLAMQCEKSDYRGILTALEGVTGKTPVDADN